MPTRCEKSRRCGTSLPNCREFKPPLPYIGFDELSQARFKDRKFVVVERGNFRRRRALSFPLCPGGGPPLRAAESPPVMPTDVIDRFTAPILARQMPLNRR
jgi:hypothetical protein